MNIRGFLMSLVIVGAAGLAGADVLGNTFTYQGVLSDGGTPVNGAVDLRFSLWDAASGGSQVGTSILVDDLAVGDGRVTVPLDFGAVFTGAELWLRIEVRDGASTGAYTVLDPRQPLTAAPFASHAIAAASADSAATAGHATTSDSATTAGHATTADSATSAMSASTAGDSDTLDGQHGSYYRAWSNLTGVPGGLDDGDDDTLADLSCAAGEVASWNGSAWVCSMPGGVSFARTIIVGPVGDPAANGAALAAVASSITPPASAADGVLIQLEPGEYDLGGANFMLWDWVHLRGSGRLATRITSEACGPVSRVISLGIGELSDLTVENTCADSSATVNGISMGSTSTGARISRVTILGSGAVNLAYGIYSGSDNLFIDNVWISLTGADSAIGISLFGSGVFLVDTVVEAHGVHGGYGLELYDDARIVISRGSYVATGSVASEGLSVYGASVDATDCSFSGGSNSIRMYGTYGSQEGFFARISAEGQLWVNGDGVDPIEVRLRHSRVSGSSAPLIRLNFGVGSLSVAATEIDGPPTTGPMTCTAVWDENGAFYPSACPP